MVYLTTKPSPAYGTRTKQVIVTQGHGAGFSQTMRFRWILDQDTGISPIEVSMGEKQAANLNCKGRVEGLETRPGDQLEKVNRNNMEPQAGSPTEDAVQEPVTQVTANQPAAESVVEELQPSCFVNLPLEIKSEIYKMLLTPKRKVYWTHTEFYLQGPGSSHVSLKTPTKRHTAILRASKQVHDEAAAILYGFSQFIFFPHYHGLKCVPEMMIPALPQRYRDLIHDVTLKAFDRCGLCYNALIWTDIRSARPPRKTIMTRRSMRIDPNSGLFRDDKWTAVHFSPHTTFEVEPLHKCRNLNNLTIEMLPSLYALAWGDGSRSYRVEEVQGIKELLKIRGVVNLKLVDMGKIEKNFPRLVATKAKLEKLLRTELLKPRRD